MVQRDLIVVPPPLKPGDLLRVIAPSGALRELEAFQQGVEIWRSRGYQVEISPKIDDRWGYLAGTDEQRRHQLATAWNDRSCRGILCVRGGFGSTRILENWTWQQTESSPIQNQHSDPGWERAELSSIQNPKSVLESLAGPKPTPPRQFLQRGEPPHRTGSTFRKIQNPKWLIGFSDITALLWSLYIEGVSSVHGPVLTTLGAQPDWSIQRLFDWVEGRPLAELKGCGWGGGVASGILLPANLTVATHLLGTPLQPELDGVILALEDVTEVPYRIDRMLTQWRMSGALKKVAGIALGSFSRCEAPPNIPSFKIEEVLRDRLGDLGIPIVSDLPFGHDGCNAALPVGVPVQLDAENGILSVAI